MRLVKLLLEDWEEDEYFGEFEEFDKMAEEFAEELNRMGATPGDVEEKNVDSDWEVIDEGTLEYCGDRENDEWMAYVSWADGKWVTEVLEHQ